MREREREATSCARRTPPPNSACLQEEERVLQRELLAAQQRVHAALCDNVNTQGAMGALCDLVKAGNVYLARRQDAAGGQGRAGGVSMAWYVWCGVWGGGEGEGWE